MNGKLSKNLILCITCLVLVLLFLMSVNQSGNKHIKWILQQGKYDTQRPDTVNKIEKQQVAICSQNQRKAYLKQMCANTSIYQSMQRLNVDPGNKILFCSISKASCTTWKLLWENANLNTRDKINIPIEVHGSAMGQANIQRKFTHNWIKNYPQYLNYTKFVVIRHPLDRVLSGYYNAIRTEKDQTKGEYGPTIKDFRKSFSLKVNDTITLTQFVEAITNPYHGTYQNRHWKPYSETCDFCNVDYDYIIRTETMSHYPDNDAAPMLKILGYQSDILHKMSFNSRTKKKTSSFIGHKYLKEFKEVPKELMEKLFKRYRNDMQLFGYKFDMETSSTLCEIDTGKHSVCC